MCVLLYTSAFKLPYSIKKVMMMMMTTFFVGIHGEPGVKRVKVKKAKIMSFCYSVTFACNFTMTEPL